jgi:amino acid transporter
MAQEQPQVKATLGLTGVTVNAMALIAPGAFLWITYQLQAAATAPDGSSVASDMWPGILLALILCFLTAYSYGELARIYPEAGFGSCYYFAEKAFLDRENAAQARSPSSSRAGRRICSTVTPSDGGDDGDALVHARRSAAAPCRRRRKPVVCAAPALVGYIAFRGDGIDFHGARSTSSD